MRVAFVSLFAPGHGDTSARSRTRRIARGLAERGHDVVWLCARWWGGDHDAFEDEGIAYRSVTAEPSPSAFAARLPLALRRVDPDVVHAVNTPPTPGIAATVAGTLSRTPVIVDWWRDHPADSRRRYRLLARRAADAVTTPSRTTKTRVREYGAAGEDVRVLPESIDFDLVESAGVDDRFDAVYARRLDRHANVETFLLGLAELRDRDWTAAVVGDGPERARIESTASERSPDRRSSVVPRRPRFASGSSCSRGPTSRWRRRRGRRSRPICCGRWRAAASPSSSTRRIRAPTSSWRAPARAARHEPGRARRRVRCRRRPRPKGCRARLCVLRPRRGA